MEVPRKQHAHTAQQIPSKKKQEKHEGLIDEYDSTSKLFQCAQDGRWGPTATRNIKLVFVSFSFPLISYFFLISFCIPVLAGSDFLPPGKHSHSSRTSNSALISPKAWSSGVPVDESVIISHAQQCSGTIRSPFQHPRIKACDTYAWSRPRVLHTHRVCCGVTSSGFFSPLF